MDKAPPARQTRPRSMTIGWAELFFTRLGGAVRTEQSRGVTPPFVSRVRICFCLL
jgi:hypothetical protein